MLKGKRYVYFIFLLMMVVGCKSKKLSCTKVTINTGEVKLEEKLDFTFKKESLTDSTFSLDYSFTSNAEKNSETMRKSLEEQFAIYNDSKGIRYSFSNLNQGIHFELRANIDKLTEEEKSNLTSIVQYKTYEGAKEELIKEGYQCN